MLEKSLKIKVIALFFALMAVNFAGSVFADVEPSLKDEFETAKMNLVIGETEKAKEQFLSLEKQVKPMKDESDANKEFYANVMYNLGLTFEQLPETMSDADILQGESSDDLLKASEYFEQADPKIFEYVASIEGTEGPLLMGGQTQVRAVGGIVGKVIKGKVKEWLTSKTNCNCIFGQEELNLAGTTFVNLTEKADIPALKDTGSRDKKIQEIFSRIKNYIAGLAGTNPVKTLFNTKIVKSCKL